MPEFVAEMRVINIETWSVNAKTEDEARQKIEAMHKDVETDESGGETTDWKIQSIRPA